MFKELKCYEIIFCVRGASFPLPANLLLDGLDWELGKRGHRFVLYADDCNIYLRSQRAGEQVLGSITVFLASRPKLTVNESKSGVSRPWRGSFLKFTFSWKLNRRVSAKVLKALKRRVREITRRIRIRRIEHIVNELNRFLQGWKAYYDFAEVCSIFQELESWIRCRVRCYIWKQWGRRGYRELRNRWVSRSPALAFALTARYFASLGLPRLFTKPT
jgi:RNA-directed DNA polymerase